MLLDIWNISEHILGSFTAQSQFSPSKQILLFNPKLDIFISYSYQSICKAEINCGSYLEITTGPDSA